MRQLATRTTIGGLGRGREVKNAKKEPGRKEDRTAKISRVPFTCHVSQPHRAHHHITTQQSERTAEHNTQHSKEQHTAGHSTTHTTMKIPFQFLALAFATTTQAFVVQRSSAMMARTNSMGAGGTIHQLSMADSSGSADAIQTGVVKWFDSQKGFGFIVPDDADATGGSDVFVHQTSIQADGFRSLAEGEKVEFMIEEDANGRIKAMQVTGPNGSDVQGQPFQPSNDYDSY